MADNKTEDFTRPSGFSGYRELLGLDETPLVLVALSGGADSVALFDMTAKLCRAEGKQFFACHVNHGIRGDEAIRDRDFCISLAKSEPTCKEIFVLNADVPALAEQSGRGLELEARCLRYDFFERIMKENQILCVATAHHANDNLETLIFNLARGSGAKGMCGIPSVRELFDGGYVVRPLLNMSKREILDYCVKNSLEFVVDSTNVENDYSRNLIRNEIVPLLQRINPRVEAHAALLSESVGELIDMASDQIDQYFDDGDGILISKLNGAHPAEIPFIFSQALKERGLDCQLERTHIEALTKLCQNGDEGAMASLPSKITAKIRNGRLCFLTESEKEDKKTTENYELSISLGKNILPDGSTLIFTDAPDEIEKVDKNIYKFATKLVLNFDTISITAKNRREGDKIMIKGINKSVKKLMCDLKVPRELRGSIPLICNNGKLISIVGFAAADSAFARKKEANAAFIWII